ncbi:MAG: helicase, partial [Proteobacteria bacterium]|nr:helicase [Pseudomonadota bacterium]
ETQWEDGFARLEAHVAGNGHCRVPANHVTGDGYRLGQWVNSQRTKRTTMSAERKSRLEALPGWTWGARETQWEEAFARLGAFVVDRGDCRVPSDHVTGDGYRLGAWVNSQRSMRDTMPADRKRRLEALPGWTWDTKETQWEDGLARLQSYVAETGHCLVPTYYVTGDGYRLGSWVHNQRRTRVTMTAERKRRLEALPGWVWTIRPTSRGAVKNAGDDGGTS